MNASQQSITLLNDLEVVAKRLLIDNQDGHDWDHTLRVRHNARMLAQQENAAPLVVEAAALLHDIARPQESRDHGKTDHAVRGAQMARAILLGLGVQDNAFIEHVAACIATHRYRRREGNAPPATLEARIVYDADKLDSMGAIGVARALHFAGRIGARVHNTAEEALASESYSREDSAYREYLVKLQYLQDAMLTSAGRTLAQQRHQFMKQFFDELNLETRP
ncbi:MAG: HD domain-containing protein [Victivallales bacterium]|nr:HD domain-containing protein [Victivallales bacterium]